MARRPLPGALSTAPSGHFDVQDLHRMGPRQQAHDRGLDQLLLAGHGVQVEGVDRGVLLAELPDEDVE